MSVMAIILSLVVTTIGLLLLGELAPTMQYETALPFLMLIFFVAFFALPMSPIGSLRERGNDPVPCDQGVRLVHMATSHRGVVLAMSVLGAAAASAFYVSREVGDVYVADFKSDNMATCRPSDVDLNRTQVADFFRRASAVESKIMNDHYDLAPCYIQGTLKYRFATCEWEVRAGATGSITCDKRIEYFVCDTCADLFQSQAK